MIVYLHYDVIRKVNAAAVAVDVTKQDEQVVKRICDVTISISKNIRTISDYSYHVVGFRRGARRFGIGIVRIFLFLSNRQSFLV